MARVLVIRIPEGGGIDVSPGSLIRRCVADARRGLYPLAMAGFVAWLGERGYRNVERELKEAHGRLEGDAWSKETHTRMPGIYGDLQAAECLWLDFALDIGAIDDAAHHWLTARSRDAILSAVAQQAVYQSSQDPVARFAGLIAEAIGGGHAHLANPQDPKGCPEDAGSWGWRDGEPQGVKLGWILDDGLYLYSSLAHAVAAEMAEKEGVPLGITSQTLNRRLKDRGDLLSTNPNKGRGIPVRRTVAKESGAFLHLRRDYLAS